MLKEALLIGCEIFQLALQWYSKFSRNSVTFPRTFANHFTAHVGMLVAILCAHLCLVNIGCLNFVT